MKEEIQLKIGGNKCLYDSLTRVVTHFTKNGVCMECEVPKDWALTRILQFMESLLKTSNELI